jgi:hypothetical protein
MRSIVWIIFTVLVSACGGLQEVAVSQGKGRLFCENLFIYEICAQDYTGDGQLDLFYFDDTKEILLYRAGTREIVQEVLPLHACAREMVATTVEAGSNLLYPPPNAGVIDMLGYRRIMVLDYMAAQEEVDSCMKANGIDVPTGDPDSDDFGDDEDMADF